AVVDTMLRVDGRRCWPDLVVAAVDLLGHAAAIAKLVEASHRERVLPRQLDASAFATLPVRWDTEDDRVVTSIRQQVAIAVAGALGRADESRNFRVAPSGPEGRSWRVTTRSFPRRHYDVVISEHGLELYDRSMRVTAIDALAAIGPSAR